MAVISILANSTAITLILPALGLVYLASWIYTYYRLSHIPGPWYAAWSDLPRMYWVWTGNSHLKQLELHRKYGPLVRLGPDAVSVSDTTEIPNIYTFTGKFKKVSQNNSDRSFIRKTMTKITRFARLTNIMTVKLLLSLRPLSPRASNSHAVHNSGREYAPTS